MTNDGRRRGGTFHGPRVMRAFVAVVAAFTLAACAGADAGSGSGSGSGSDTPGSTPSVDCASLAPHSPVSSDDPPCIDERPPTTGWIQGRVTDSAGEPIAGAFFSAVALEGGGPIPEIGVLTDDDGRYSFPSLSPGVYELTASAEGYADAKGEATVRAGTAATLDLVLERASA